MIRYITSPPQEKGLNVTVARDGSYDGVMHLVTAADGAEEFYTLDNNDARSEDLSAAIDVDNNVQNVWSGCPHHYILYVMNCCICILLPCWHDEMLTSVSAWLYRMRVYVPVTIATRPSTSRWMRCCLESLKNCPCLIPDTQRTVTSLLPYHTRCKHRCCTCICVHFG